MHKQVSIRTNPVFRVVTALAGGGPGRVATGAALHTTMAVRELWLSAGDPDEPKIPHRRPARARERNRIGRAAARYLRTLPLWQQVRFLARVGWLANEAGHTIRSYSDEPRALEELKGRATFPRSGYDIHHIVEKTPAYRDGFSREMIESPQNKVLVPRYKHWEITAWYARNNKEWGGVSPRAYLRGRNWEERELMGRYALRKFGVLK
ncbi:hypothetical protein [Nitratireductor sp. L15S-10]|uniref:hypothetical protein n=1 Tax=Nitratireductor sp. L15S-10 TaxID=3034028 RepID=UPI0038572E3D